MNQFFTKLMTVMMTAMISLSVNPYKVADAGCNCQNGSNVMNSMPMQNMQMSSPYNRNRIRSARVNVLPAVAVPEGSLGFTYKKCSRLIPEDKHPRVGMLEVTGIPHGYDVIVDGMKSYITETGTRMFESKRPLLPHRKHIYQIEVKQTVDQLKPDVRTIRLIPGRVVDYEYKCTTQTF